MKEYTEIVNVEITIVYKANTPHTPEDRVRFIMQDLEQKLGYDDAQVKTYKRFERELSDKDGLDRLDLVGVQ